QKDAYKAADNDRLDKVAVQNIDRRREIVRERIKHTDARMELANKQSGRQPLTRNVGKDKVDRSVGAFVIAVIIAADLATGRRFAVDLVIGQLRRGVGKELLLDFGADGKLGLNGLLFEHDGMHSGVLNGQAGLPRKPFHQAFVLFGENLSVFSIEQLSRADDLAVYD